MPGTTGRAKAPVEPEEGPKFEIDEGVKLKPMSMEEDPPACVECFPNGWVGNETATAVGCPHGTWSRQPGVLPVA
jgi:hypothetical protein